MLHRLRQPAPPPNVFNVNGFRSIWNTQGTRGRVPVFCKAPRQPELREGPCAPRKADVPGERTEHWLPNKELHTL